MKICRSHLTRFFALTSLMATAGLVLAAEPITPIYKISDTQSTFIQVPLTQNIYRYNLQPDLQNLVVLDAEQNPLPYKLVSLMPAVQQTEQPVIRDNLLFFPIAVDASADTLRKLHSEKMQFEAGTLQLTTTDKVLNNNTPEFYLVDLSKLDHAITGLTIDWDAQADTQYLELELEASRNLQEWVSLGRSTLVQIIHWQQSLKKNKIDISIAKNQYQFLRVRVIRGAENLRLTAVTAEQKTGPVPVVPLARESWSLPGELAKVQSEVDIPNVHNRPGIVAAWEFVRDESTPVETVAIDFDQQTYGNRGKIFSRTAENKSWELQHQGIFFHAQIGSQWQSGDPVSIHSKSPRYWRIELNESARDKIQPRLVFAWQPSALQIITNNKPPFSIAVTGVNSNNNHSKQVFNQLAALSSPEWEVATLISLDIKPETIKSTPSKIDWAHYLFWAALLLAVLVLFIFSLKLFKQLNISAKDN